MLSQQMRLKHPRDFERVWQQGTYWRGHYISLKIGRNDLSNSRFGFVASRRIGNAVVRNRAKRRLRAAIYHSISDITPGFDIIVIASHRVIDAGFNCLVADIVNVFDKAHLTKGVR